MIKKLCIIACLLLGTFAAQAQHNVTSFFDEFGSARIKTEEFSKVHDTVVMVDHRIDDVIWARYLYRIIDLRYRQNMQLYFPTRADDADYRNLLLVIADAICDGLPVYEKSQKTLKPDFKQGAMDSKMIPNVFFLDGPTANGVDYSEVEKHSQICCSDEMLIHYDTITGEFERNNYPFSDITKNQVKYLIQEVVFFDKHTSRLHTKIMAIAPLWSAQIEAMDSTRVMDALRESITCWIPYDQLRPYLAMQYAIPNRNETKRVTYDEFFQKRLFTSYIVGEGNMYNRWIPDYAGTYEEIKKEQERIATELLNFEQDLWEY